MSRLIYDSVFVQMAKAGIDTTRFKAHSTRAAATSKAKATGLNMADILKAGVWSRESTFEQFYHKLIQASTFGLNVLDSLQNVSLKPSTTVIPCCLAMDCVVS